MRRLIVIAFLSLLIVPAAAVAADRGGDRASVDGSLTVTGASGTVIVQGNGLIFGHLAQGTLWIVQYKPDDPATAPSVTGAKPRLVGGYYVYTGSNIRFLLPSGRYTVELTATGIDLSGVGKGIASAIGLGTLDDGSFAANGGKALPITKVNTSQAFGGKTLTQAA